MIVTSLLGLSLALNVSLIQSPNGPPVWSRNATQLSVRRKEAALLPLVRRATDCIVRHVSADPRLTGGIGPDAVNGLIIDSIAACKRPVRAMIDAHDRMYGDGSGEAFLLGPYLDVLPSAVVKQVKVKFK
jgi:hypothetical protein